MQRTAAAPSPAAQLVDGALLAVAAPLDRGRSLVLRATGRLLVPLLRRRELRVALGGSLGLLVSFGLAVLAPLWLMALGPLVLGVPHLLSDLRYLVARPGLHRRRGFIPLVALPAAATLFMPSLSLALVAVAGAALLAATPWRRRVVAAALALAAAAGVAQSHGRFEILFAQAHNGIAIAIWWLWRPRRPRYQWIVPALFALFVTLLALRGVDWLYRFGSLAEPRPGLDAASLAATVSPAAAPLWALRFLLIFAFAQSAHYAVWLRLVPDDLRPRPGLRSFRASLRALVADCGRPLVLGALLLAAAFAAGALVDLAQARSAYLRLALFHGPLELGALVLWLLEGRPLQGSAPGAVRAVAAGAPA